MDLAGNTDTLQGVEAGSEQCKEPDDEKLLQVVCRWIKIRQFNGKVQLSWPVLPRSLKTEWIEEDGA
jgi:hypothetical protein